ncbi:MAG: MFS transporter, partial [Thermocrispum sp.]
SESVLQMAWCCGGAVGLLLPATYWVGFLVVSIMLVLGLVQTLIVQRGGTLLPSRAALRRGTREPADGAGPAEAPKPRTTQWTAK